MARDCQSSVTVKAGFQLQWGQNRVLITADSSRSLGGGPVSPIDGFTEHRGRRSRRSEGWNYMEAKQA